MIKKPRITEEFLWALYKISEGLADFHQATGLRSFRDVAAPEMRKLRFAYEQKKRKKSFSQFLSYLKARGYIKVPEGKSLSVLQLTKKGMQKALEGNAKTKGHPLRKDGKMIMLMFDIPKKKARVRQAFRSALEFLDFQMLQKSVWVSDKDVLEETERVVQEYGLNDCVNLFVIERVRVQ